MTTERAIAAACCLLVLAGGGTRPAGAGETPPLAPDGELRAQLARLAERIAQDVTLHRHVSREALGGLLNGSPEAATALVAAFRHATGQLRTEALAALRALAAGGDERICLRLIELIPSAGAEERARLLEILGSSGTPAALPFLASVMEGPEEALHPSAASAVVALVRGGASDEVVGLFQRRLSKATKDERSRIAGLLSAAGGEEVVASILRGLTGGQLDLKGELRDRLASLAEMIARDEDLSRRIDRKGLNGLRSGEPEGVAALVAVVEHGSGQLRQNALRALRSLALRAEELLVPIVVEMMPNVKKAAREPLLEILGASGSPAALPYLMSVACGPDEETHHAAASALVALARNGAMNEVVSRLRAWLLDAEQEERRELVRRLTAAGGEEALELALADLGEKLPGLLESAKTMILHAKGPSVEQAAFVGRLWEEQDPVVVKRLIRRLSQESGEEGIAALLMCLHAPDAGVRTAACTQLNVVTGEDTRRSASQWRAWATSAGYLDKEPAPPTSPPPAEARTEPDRWRLYLPAGVGILLILLVGVRLTRRKPAPVARRQRVDAARARAHDGGGSGEGAVWVLDGKGRLTKEGQGGAKKKRGRK